MEREGGGEITDKEAGSFGFWMGLIRKHEGVPDERDGKVRLNVEPCGEPQSSGKAQKKQLPKGELLKC